MAVDKSDRQALQKRLADLADLSHEVFWSDSDAGKRQAALANLDAIPAVAARLAKAIRRDATTTKRAHLREQRLALAELLATTPRARKRSKA